MLLYKYVHMLSPEIGGVMSASKAQTEERAITKCFTSTSSVTGPKHAEECLRQNETLEKHVTYTQSRVRVLLTHTVHTQTDLVDNV